MSTTLEELPVIVWSCERDLERKVRTVSRGIIVVREPVSAYKILRKAVENWSAYHVQPVKSANPSPMLLHASKILLSERERLGGLPKRFNRMREVSRRSLLSRLAMVREGFCGPVKGHLASSLSDSAAEALSRVCPYNALNRLEVRGRSCNECGICYSFLPVGVLENPLLPFQAVRAILEAARVELQGLRIMYFDLAREKEAYEIVLKADADVLALPLTGGQVPWWLPLLHCAYGIRGVVLANRTRYLQYVFSDAEAITGGELVLCTEPGCAEEVLRAPGVIANRSIQKVTERNIVKVAMNASPRSLPMGSSLPPKAVRSFIPRVYRERCIFCGTCARSCPYDALLMEAEPRTPRLILVANACQGCWNCVGLCPTGAITDLEPLLLGADHVLLVQDELVHCIHCGAPVGPRNRVEYVERKLVESGMNHELARGMVRVCANCRTSRALVSG